jgi:type IX secretion system PorP/SprF family membrane protein
MKRVVAGVVYGLMVWMMFPGHAQAQDPQFSQYYATPLYLNPAFAGANTDHRVMLNYRNQWPGAVPNSFVTYVFSYDFNWQKYNSGLGLLAVRDKAGTSGLSYTNIGGVYSYQVQLSKEFYLRSGVHFSYTTKDLDFSRLLFNDQLERGGGVTFESSRISKIQYLDVAAGAIAYNKNLFVGFAAHHLTQPNESFTGQDSRVPLKMSLHAGYRIGLGSRDRDKSLLPTFNYRVQDNFTQLDMGCYYNHEPLVLGVWYRGIPLSVFNKNDYINNDAFMLLVGYSMSDQPLSFGYSYDLTVSRLILNSGGSHEVSMIYEFGKGNSRRSGKNSYNKHRIPCAKF